MSFREQSLELLMPVGILLSISGVAVFILMEHRAHDGAAAPTNGNDSSRRLSADTIQGTFSMGALFGLLGYWGGRRLMFGEPPIREWEVLPMLATTVALGFLGLGLVYVAAGLVARVRRPAGWSGQERTR